jgi:hypothetical protein
LALIVGSILGLLLICGLIMFVMFRKRSSREPTELSQEPVAGEFEETATWVEDALFISQYGLSASDEPSSEEGEEDAASFLGSISDGYSLEDPDDDFMSEYGFNDDFHDSTRFECSDEPASGDGVDYDDSNVALGYSDELPNSGRADSGGDLYFSHEYSNSGDRPTNGEPRFGHQHWLSDGGSRDDGVFDFARTDRLSDDCSALE